MISLEKLQIFTPLQKLPKNVWELGKLIVATGFECLPKVQKIAQSGHTGRYLHSKQHKRFSVPRVLLLWQTQVHMQA